MTVRERVLSSRLIQKIDNQRDYAKNIGISYTIVPVQVSNEKIITQAVKRREKNYKEIF